MANTAGLSFHLLIFMTVAITSCNGQVATHLPKDDLSKQKTLPNGQQEMVKTQGSNEYQIIACSLQDKTGNLWFGTSGEGLYRYDGKSFTNFTTKDGLCSNAIFFMIEDKGGNIWFGSRDGLCYYDGRKFTRIPVPANTKINFQFYQSSGSNLSTKNELWSLMQDRSGKMWLGTSDGVYCYDGKSFTRFLDNTSIINKDSVHLKWTQCIFEDKKGNIWFGSWVLANEGICLYDGKSITHFKPYGEGWIRSFLEDKNGDLLVVTRHNGVCRFDGKTFINFTKDGGLNNGSVNTAMEDKEGNLWLGTELGSGELNEDGGLWRYNGKTFTRFTTKDGLCHNGVYCITEDKGGNLWIGTRNTGLCRYNGKTFTNFSK